MMQYKINYRLLCIVFAAVFTGKSEGKDLENKKTVNTVAENIRFDPLFINSEIRDRIDLHHFEEGDVAIEGIFPVDFYVNGKYISRSSVKFERDKDKKIIPCFNKELLNVINIDLSKLSTNDKEKLLAIEDKKTCKPLSYIINDVSETWDPSNQELNYIIPQILMNHNAQGYVNPELWDKGITALILGYDTSSYSVKNHGKTENSTWSSFNAGINIDGWYFRNDMNYSWNENNGGKYNTIASYVQHGLPSIKGQAFLGKMNTQGKLFDTLPFKGIEIMSDDRMYPRSQRGYAPDIRGVAKTNARVVIKQNGTTLYETSVSPGAFLIDDLYPMGYGGDLDVTVYEADGSVQSFRVPYASVTELLRPGHYRYDFAVGKIDDSTLGYNPNLYQFTWQHGVTNLLTTYAGVQGSGADYYALLFGSALSTPLGAFSADVTQARLHMKDADNSSKSGQSYRLSYSKYLSTTDSTLTIAAYRYSTDDYYDFYSAVRNINRIHKYGEIYDLWHPKSRFNITLNQGLPDNYGSLWISGYTQNYWDKKNTDIQYQAGYSNSWYNLSYSLSANRVRNSFGHVETNWLLNFSLPLGNSYGDNNSQTISGSSSYNSDGLMGQQIGISGNLGSDNQYSYGVSTSYYNQGRGNSLSISSAWRTPYTNLTANSGYGKSYSNMTLGANGTIIAWKDGITASPYSGDTFAIIEAKDAPGAKVSSYPGIKLDPWGHAVVPYLTPYEMNEISIDPKGLPESVALESTTEKVAPYAGAVSKIMFKTEKGFPLFIKIKNKDSQIIPFGSEITDNNGNNVGFVGQNGQAFVRVKDEIGSLNVKWGSNALSSCNIKYDITERMDVNGLTTITGNCK
ncbi:fimbria/pilus outer membrane usher protein [Escherichia coli]